MAVSSADTGALAGQPPLGDGRTLEVLPHLAARGSLEVLLLLVAWGPLDGGTGTGCTGEPQEPLTGDPQELMKKLGLKPVAGPCCGSDSDVTWIVSRPTECSQHEGDKRSRGWNWGDWWE